MPAAVAATVTEARKEIYSADERMGMHKNECRRWRLDFLSAQANENYDHTGQQETHTYNQSVLRKQMSTRAKERSDPVKTNGELRHCDLLAFIIEH